MTNWQLKLTGKIQSFAQSSCSKATWPVKWKVSFHSVLETQVTRSQPWAILISQLFCGSVQPFLFSTLVFSSAPACDEQNGGDTSHFWSPQYRENRANYRTPRFSCSGPAHPGASPLPSLDGALELLSVLKHGSPHLISSPWHVLFLFTLG